jgi:pyruvate dehydrogenase (quinone)/pyruvate oxidase
MSTTAADALVQTLIDWKVEVIFGLPGDGINGIIEALRKRQDEIRFIQVRHEEAAAFAACAYAKFSGRLGVCLATSGPGGIHLLNGIYDAKLDGQPVLAITGLQFHDLIETHTQQDVELDKLFMDACAYSARIMGPAHVENVVELACRTALSYRQPTHVTMPVDVQSLAVSKDERTPRNRKHHVSHRMARSGHSADRSDLVAAVDLLNEAKKPFILAGRGARGARKQVQDLSMRLAAPVGMPLLGKGAIPDLHPNAVGGVGLLGTKPAQEAMEDCDTLVIVGSSFPYIEFYPKNARAVQIDIDAARIGLRYPIEVGLVGDSANVLDDLIPLIKPNANKQHLERAQRDMTEWRETLKQRGSRPEIPMKPQVVAHTINSLLDDDAIIIADSGTITTWAARHIEMRGEQMFSCSGTLASMACGLPYIVGAAAAYPGRQIVAFVGDGGAAMIMGELATICKYGINAKIVVFKNDSLGQIRWEQMVFLGNPEYACELEPIDFAKVALGFGLRSMRIEDPARAAEQLSEAMAYKGPCLIEAVIDPNEPPMPPKVKAEQMLHLAEAMARGTPHRGKLAMTLAADVVREIV